MYDKLKPKTIPPDVWDIIIDAWENGLSDREASMRALRDCNVIIKESEIKEMVHSNADIANLKDFLMSDLTSRARLNIAEEIRDGNVAVSKWFLEKKAPDEFGSKAAVQFEGAVVGLTMEEKQAAMDDFLKQYE